MKSLTKEQLFQQISMLQVMVIELVSIIRKVQFFSSPELLQEDITPEKLLSNIYAVAQLPKQQTAAVKEVRNIDGVVNAAVDLVNTDIHNAEKQWTLIEKVEEYKRFCNG